MKRINRNSVGKLTLDEIVDIVPGIYSNKDTHRSVWDVWLHATHHAAAIGEELRKYKPGRKLLEEIADFSMWLFTFTDKIKGPFEDLKGGNVKKRIGELTIKTEKELSKIIWNKYPGVCPVCFWRRFNDGKTQAELGNPCDCLIYEVEDRDKVEDEEAKLKKEEERKRRVVELRKYAESLQKEPSKITIDEWQETFKKIYAANLRHISLVDIGFHLLEEVGEVSDAMVRMYTYNEKLNGQPRLNQIWLEEEIADVFSWLLTLVNSLQIMPNITKEFFEYLGVPDIIKIHEDEIKLSKIIWKRYGSDENKDFRCYNCHEPRCECDIFFVGENMKYDEFRSSVKNNEPIA